MNPTDDPTDLPPPSADEVARRQPQLEPERKHPTLKILGITAAALIGLGALSAINSANDDDDNDGGGKMTLTDAACKLLREGEDSEFTYSVMKDLAADHPLVYGEDESIAARLAVEQAQAKGC